MNHPEPLTIDDGTLLESLRSETCPACGAPKQSRKTLCGPCYYKLPRPLARALYCRIGEGYAEAFAAAMKHHGVEQIRMPQTRAARKVQG